MKIVDKITERINKIDKRYIIILIVALLIFVPYMSNKFVEGSDYRCHIANIYAIDQYISIEEGNIFPSKINPIMANNTGYGNGIFYPQLSYYITEFIYLIIKHFGFTIIDSIKTFEFIVMLLSGIFMYKFVSKTFNNKDSGMVSAITYMCAPYFISDVFHRMAYTEIMIFLFIPIVLTSIYYIFNKVYNKFLIYFIIGYIGMIHSHLVMTFFFTMLLVIILLINIKKVWNKKAILSFAIGTVVVLAISSPFLGTMFEHKIHGNYVVFEDGMMYDMSKLMGKRLDLYDLFNNHTSKPIRFYISSIVWIFCGITIYKGKQIFKDDKDRKIMIFSICIVTIVAFIFSSNLINWEKMPKLFCFIQFPWRMCTFMVVGTSIVAGLAITVFKGESKKIAIIILCIVCIFDINYVLSEDKLKELGLPSDESVANIDGSLGWRREYLPVNTLNNIEYLKNRNKKVIVKEGNAQAKIIKNKTPYLQFEIEVLDNQTTKIEIPRLFYLGYNIEINKLGGEKETLSYYENDNGFMEFETNYSGIVTVEYKGTTLNKIANIIACITLILFIIYNLMVFYNKKIYINKGSLKNAKN